MARKTQDLPTMKGDLIRATHQASVTALLGENAPPVVSCGSEFMHKARWTSRHLVASMCTWAKDNPGCCPTRENVAEWVKAANFAPNPSPQIQIAATPERVTTRLAMALIGGAYHEALHGLLSCKRNLRVDEVASIVLPRWAKVPDWSKLTKLLLGWSNIVEDIRIERLGRVKFPGSYVKLCDLQDFILGKETLSRANANAVGQHEATKRTLTIASGVFRDIGLGYNTDAQRLAMSTYRTLNPEAVKLVLDGPLSPLLREAIALDDKDDLGSLRIALDVVAVLVSLSEVGQEDEDQQEGQSGKVACPQCQAPASKLKVRPLSDGYGGKVPGKGVLTCTSCGYQEVIDLQDGQGGQGTPDPDNAIEYEDMPQEAPQDAQGGSSGQDKGADQEQQSGGSQGKPEGTPDDDSEDSSGQGRGDESKGESEGDSEGDSEGSQDKGDGSEGSQDKGAGDSDEDESDEDESEGSKGADDSDDAPEGADDSDDAPEGADDSDDAPEGSKGDPPEEGGKHQSPSEDAASDTHPGKHEGGGHNDTGEDWTALADEMLNSADEGAGIHDASSALAESFNEELEAEDASCQDEEAPYRPFDASLDQVHLVKPVNRDAAGRKSDKLLNSVKRESSYLRARLRNIVRALEQTDVEHGLRRGRGISQRMLVDSKCALLGGQAPDRAYYDTTDQIDTSLAAAVVIDESGSMCSLLQDATRVLMAITEPLDGLGCPVQVSGFRDGCYVSSNGDGGDLQYHRYEGVRHDVFKMFDEKFSSVKYRFSCTRATGGTPMADGVKFGLDGLNERQEAHRILFVVTDGCPNYGHLPVIKRLIRIANEAGIHVVGVGLGYSAQYVQDVFPDYVYSPNIRGIPKELVRKLNQLLDFTGAKRGQRMKKVS
jgi:hypothetical protein